MTLLRRWLLLVALMFWQGGFMFYGAVVVPVGSEALGSHLAQGVITRSVTNYLNMAGVIALGFWCWDLIADRRSASRRHWLRWLAWGLLVALLAALALLHPRLDELFDAANMRVLDRPRHRQLHQWYLIVSTVQWAIALILVAWTVWGWRLGDTGRRS